MSGPEGTVPKDLCDVERCLAFRVRRARDIRKGNTHPDAVPAGRDHGVVAGVQAFLASSRSLRMAVLLWRPIMYPARSFGSSSPISRSLRRSRSASRFP